MNFLDRALTLLSEESDLSISINDIKPTKSAIEYAKKIKKMMDKGVSYKDAFQEATKIRTKRGALEIGIVNHLKSLGIDVKHCCEKE